MKRPFIFCHMLVSLNGKIMGPYMETPAGEAAGEVFDRIAFGENPYYHHQGWISGRVTTDDNFTLYEKPDLDETVTAVPEGDFYAQGAGAPWYISIDPSGVLGWKENYIDYGGLHASVLEVLTEKASPAYRAFLRKLGISYIIAGKDRLDAALAMEKLAEDFHMDTVMLGGGGIVNWSFIQQGLCDEVSLVVAAAADGDRDTQSVFDVKPGLSDTAPVEFFLLEAKVMDGGALWLRYRVGHTRNE